jgi:iron complex outermembrane receptor protein
VNKNKITYLTKSDDPNYFVPVGSISVGTGSHIQAQMVGHAANSFYVYEQVYDNSGNPIEGQFVDRNKNGVIDDGDRMIYHSPDPKVVMAWNNTVNYKNWDFGMSLRANFGNYVYDNTLASNDNKAANTSVPLSNLMNNTFLFKEMTVKQAMSSYFVRNASFLRCDNITLGYTCKGLVQNQLRLRIYGAVQNPFVITKYKGLDPEVFGGIDNAVYPRPVTFTLGVVAQF